MDAATNNLSSVATWSLAARDLYLTRWLLPSNFVLVGLLISSTPVIAADGSLPPDYQYLCGSYGNYLQTAICTPNGPKAQWVDTVQEVGEQFCAQYLSPGTVGTFETVTDCRIQSSVLNDGPPFWWAPELTVHPVVTLSISFKDCGSLGCLGSGPYSVTYTFGPRVLNNPPRYFLRNDSPPPLNAQPNACCENKLFEPIDPASGATLNVFDDFQTGIPFHRFYSSLGSADKSLGTAWHHTYERNIVAKYSNLIPQLYVSSTRTSSKYDDASSACTSGFAELQANTSAWAGASVVYANGSCQLMKNGNAMGSVPIYFTRNKLPLWPAVVGYDAIRDDGQVVSFMVNGGYIVSKPTTGLKFLQTSSGYSLTDENDIVEQYDGNGRLLSVAGRAGVTKTVGYDASGRLSSVVDSFGHQLLLTYDAQGRLVSVTRQ